MEQPAPSQMGFVMAPPPPGTQYTFVPADLVVANGTNNVLVPPAPPGMVAWPTSEYFQDEFGNVFRMVQSNCPVTPASALPAEVPTLYRPETGSIVCPGLFAPNPVKLPVLPAPSPTPAAPAPAPTPAAPAPAPAAPAPAPAPAAPAPAAPAPAPVLAQRPPPAKQTAGTTYASKVKAQLSKPEKPRSDPSQWQVVKGKRVFKGDVVAPVQARLLCDLQSEVKSERDSQLNNDNPAPDTTAKPQRKTARAAAKKAGPKSKDKRDQDEDRAIDEAIQQAQKELSRNAFNIQKFHAELAAKMATGQLLPWIFNYYPCYRPRTKQLSARVVEGRTVITKFAQLIGADTNARMLQFLGSLACTFVFQPSPVSFKWQVNQSLYTLFQLCGVEPCLRDDCTDQFKDYFLMMAERGQIDGLSQSDMGEIVRLQTVCMDPIDMVTDAELHAMSGLDDPVPPHMITMETSDSSPRNNKPVKVQMLSFNHFIQFAKDMLNLHFVQSSSKGPGSKPAVELSVCNTLVQPVENPPCNCWRLEPQEAGFSWGCLRCFFIVDRNQFVLHLLQKVVAKSIWSVPASEFHWGMARNGGLIKGLVNLYMGHHKYFPGSSKYLQVHLARSIPEIQRLQDCPARLELPQPVNDQSSSFLVCDTSSEETKHEPWPARYVGTHAAVDEFYAISSHELLVMVRSCVKAHMKIIGLGDRLSGIIQRVFDAVVTPPIVPMEIRIQDTKSDHWNSKYAGTVLMYEDNETFVKEMADMYNMGISTDVGISKAMTAQHEPPSSVVPALLEVIDQHRLYAHKSVFAVPYMS